MPPTVSIVIPTHDEAVDIRATLDAALALDHDDLEVVVVDASRDATPEIVSRYPCPPVRLLHQAPGRGRAAARNEGIRAARGEILVILNADVRLPRDFVRRILSYYAAGADYVLVESRVSNVETAPARYVQASHERDYPPRPEVEASMQWTEGFSCRRSAALAVGLMPEGAAGPLVAGEDGWFGDLLAAAGYRKAFDRSIVVTHVAPPNLSGFWRQRVGRGQGGPQILHARRGWPLHRIIPAAFHATVRHLLIVLVPLLPLWQGWRLSAYSPRGRVDWLPFAALTWVEAAANARGIAQGVLDLWRAGVR
jgi:cellulose synthase/poly-beta-1,6-N-acetylglucosamine synthase-like glycosyltransferase